MKENEEKENPHPSRMRGRGVESVEDTFLWGKWWECMKNMEEWGKSD